MMKDGTVKKEFLLHDSQRQESLERARHCASLTKPWILPPDGWSEDQKLPSTFSSLAARGITNLEGRLLLALFPPGMPFFRFRPSSRFRFDPGVDPQQLSEFSDLLHLQEMVVMAHLDSMDRAGHGNARRAGFRSRMRTAISQLLVTGDVLVHMTDDVNLRVFRRDNYVTKRNSSGDIQCHITLEKIDPATLNSKQLDAIDMDAKSVLAKPAYERMEDMYTRVMWHPVTKRWVIEQEINGKTILESEESVTPYFSVPFELPPAANYGRGLIEQNLGDVRSMNELTERLLDFAALSSKLLFAVDYSSQVRPEDLARSTGEVIQARVQSGQVTDVGMLKVDKLQDFNIVGTTRESIRKDLAVTMLMEGETTPRGERVTAFQVQRVAMELEGALGGVYAPIADAMQIPLIERVLEVLRRKKIMPSLPDETVEVEAVTGIQALTNESDNGKLMQLMQTIAQLGPETMGRVDKGILMDLLVRQSGIYEPGLIKSDEQVQQEEAEAQKAAMKQQVQAQAIQSGGNIMEQRAAQQPTEEPLNV